MTDYCTKAEVKAQINRTQSTDDDVIDALITAASRAIDNYCNRPDGFVAVSTATARIYTGQGGAVQPIDECISVSAVAVKVSPTDDDYTAWTTSDWIAFTGDPMYPDFNRTPYTMLMVDPTGDEELFTNGRYANLRGFTIAAPQDALRRGVPTVQVTAKWGYAETVPNEIKQATIIQVSRWLKRGQSSWADTLASADFGQLLYKQPLDPAVQMILKLGRFMRPSVG